MAKTSQHHEDPGTNRVTAPSKDGKPKPSFSQFAHWAWMNQSITDAGWRYYSAVRSYIFDSDEDFELDITDEVIAELLGKSAKTVSRARKDCYRAGLIEELCEWRESVRIEGKASQEVRRFRRLIVHHEVPEGYEGPVNAYREKRRIEKRRHQEQKEARAARQAARREGQLAAPDGTNLSGHSDQEEHNGDSKTPAQREGTDLSEVGTDLSEVGTDLSANTGDEQAKQVPHLPSHLPSHQPTSATEHDSAVSESIGWLDARRKIPDTPGARYLLNLAFPNGEGFGAAAIRALHEHVSALLASGWTEQDITERITNTNGVSTVKSWPAFARTKLDALQPIPSSGANASVGLIPQWCGECEDGPRVTRDGKKCGTCHPRFANKAA